MAEGQPTEKVDTLPDPAGCVVLVEHLWRQAHQELEAVGTFACNQAVRWVLGEDKSQGAGFAFWCELSGSRPEVVRAHLEERYPEAFARYNPRWVTAFVSKGRGGQRRILR